MTVKNKANQKNVAPLVVNRPSLQLITDPYPQSSMALPLIDTRNGQLLGESMTRYSNENMIRAALHGGGAVPDTDRFITFVGDTAPPGRLLAGTGMETPTDQGTAHASSLMLPQTNCSETATCHEFDTITVAMHSGSAGLGSFSRDVDGRQEHVFVAYAPVDVKTYRSTDPSDFGRGVTEHRSAVYSVAFAQSEESIAAGYAAHSETLRDTLRENIWTLLIVALVATAVLVPVSAWVAVFISIPIFELCELVTNVNR